MDRPTTSIRSPLSAARRSSDLVGPGTPSARTPSWRKKRVRPVRLIADVGLILLPALLVETLTGAVLFAFGHGLVPKGSDWAQAAFDFLAAHNLVQLQDVGFQTDVHVWAGYLTAWAIVLKAIASWPTLVGWWPRRFAPLHLAVEKAAAWGLLVLAPASYLTGAALALHLVSLREHLVHDLHLYVSALLVLVLAWHVWHFLPTGLRVMLVQVRHLATSQRRPL